MYFSAFLQFHGCQLNDCIMFCGTCYHELLKHYPDAGCLNCSLSSSSHPYPYQFSSFSLSPLLESLLPLPLPPPLLLRISCRDYFQVIFFASVYIHARDNLVVVRGYQPLSKVLDTISCYPEDALNPLNNGVRI